LGDAVARCLDCQLGREWIEMVTTEEGGKRHLSSF